MRELHVYEGTWEEIAQHAAEFTGRRLRLSVVDDEKSNEVTPSANAYLTFGMFKGEPEVTEEDFKLAEWRGEDINSLLFASSLNPFNTECL